MIRADYAFVTHRGMHSIKQNIPENSEGAFKLSIQNKFAIHFEVQLTMDNGVLVFGDENFKRLCSLDMKPQDCYLDEASRLMLNGTEYRILTFKQALEIINGQVPILIEIIDENQEIGIIEQKVVDELQNYSGVFAIQSKNPMVTLWFKNHYPHIQRGQIINESETTVQDIGSFLKKALLKTQAINFVSSPNFITYNIDELSQNYANECRKKNIAVLGYTARTEEQLKKAKEMCDGIIFEEISII